MQGTPGREKYFQYSGVRTASQLVQEPALAPSLRTESLDHPKARAGERLSRPLLGAWTRAQKGALAVLACLMIAFVLGNLLLQYRIDYTDSLRWNYQASTKDLRSNADILNEEIMEKYNFQKIQEVVESEGMTVDPSRIKDVNG